MRLLTVLFLLLAFVANAQLGAKTKQSNQLTGLWQNNQFGYQMTLMLNADGTGEFDGEAIKYAAKGNMLTLITQNESTNYNYVLNGNSLTVSGGDLDQPVAFTKAGGNSETSSPVTTTTPATATNSALDKSLFGTWSGNGESMEFKPDGTCLYAGHTFKYTASGGQITLITQQGNAVIPYTVRGGQLVINSNGQDFTYNKGTAGAQTTNTQPASTGQKSVPPELAGNWCVMKSTSSSTGGSFSSECITLNPDGTYIYSTESSRSVQTQDLAGGTSSQGGDRGQWWMEGDRLFYNSPQYGTGSYRLEKRNHPKNVNDPMIVLDGKAYVTTKLKEPWR